MAKKSIELIIVSDSKNLAKDYAESHNIKLKYKVVSNMADVSGLKDLPYIKITQVISWNRLLIYFNKNNIYEYKD